MRNILTRTASIKVCCKSQKKIRVFNFEEISDELISAMLLNVAADVGPIHFFFTNVMLQLGFSTLLYQMLRLPQAWWRYAMEFLDYPMCVGIWHNLPKQQACPSSKFSHGPPFFPMVSPDILMTKLMHLLRNTLGPVGFTNLK